MQGKDEERRKTMVSKRMGPFRLILFLFCFSIYILKTCCFEAYFVIKNIINIFFFLRKNKILKTTCSCYFYSKKPKKQGQKIIPKSPFASLAWIFTFQKSLEREENVQKMVVKRNALNMKLFSIIFQSSSLLILHPNDEGKLFQFGNR